MPELVPPERTREPARPPERGKPRVAPGTALPLDRVLEAQRASGNHAVALAIQRQAQPGAPTEPVTTDVPESSPTDGEFWVEPPRIRPGAVPLFDDEDTRAVIGFRYDSGGYWEVYDLNGRLVETGEAPLESPLIDPIDILVGLGLGLFVRGGMRAAGRAAGRAAAGAAAGTGARGIARLAARATIDAIRATYRALRLRGTLRFTATAGAHMAEAGRRVPLHIINLALRYGTRTPDPRGVAGAFRYTIPMFRNGRQYTLEVVIREADRTILHFLYR